MIKPGDLRTKKTIHELVKEFPEKTYGELEKYRNADRQEEAQQIILQQENEELTESQQKQAELEPIEGVDWEKLYNKEHKLRQEAETETILVKGIGMNSPEMKEAKAKLGYLQDELDRVKRENNDLHNKVAALLDAVSPEKNLKKARESGL
jgi:hypothetical protein|tara:strand:+ start:187 stop:639 length:453 start_codon:yes stop_codon:yes gene_type:complete